MRRNDTQRAVQTHGQLAETHKDGAHTHRNAAQGHKNGGQRLGAKTENDVQRESYRTQTSDTTQAQRMDHNAQTPRKHREWTRAMDDAATVLERKRNQKFECPGVTPAANYRGPGRPGARADVAGQNPCKPPPRPALRTLATRPPTRTRKFR